MTGQCGCNRRAGAANPKQKPSARSHFPHLRIRTALDSNATRFDGRSVPQKRPTNREPAHTEMIKETNLRRNCQSLLTLQSARLPTAPQRDTFHMQLVRLCSIRKSRAAGPGPERKKAACHHSNSQHSQSGTGLHSCFPGDNEASTRRATTDHISPLTTVV